MPKICEGATERCVAWGDFSGATLLNWASEVGKLAGLSKLQGWVSYRVGKLQGGQVPWKGLGRPLPF